MCQFAHLFPELMLLHNLMLYFLLLFYQLANHQKAKIQLYPEQSMNQADVEFLLNRNLKALYILQMLLLFYLKKILAYLPD